MTKSSSDRHSSRVAGSKEVKSGRPRQARSERLDPEARTLLKMIGLAERKTITHASLRRKRLAWRLSAQALGRGADVARVESLQIPGPEAPIELRLYRPTANAELAPAFLWFHGGGFLMGGLSSADTICRHLASTSGAVVIAARYRLAPEHDLYAGREDCMAVLDWAAREGHAYGIDEMRLAVGGDSAGGNLAAAVAQRAVDRRGPALRLQALVYPATNLRDDFPSKSENARGYLLTSDGMDAIKAMITEAHPDLADPWISPGLRADLRDLPPTLMLTAGFDPIRDDGLAYAERLRDAGVPVELLHYAGQFHGFLNFDGVLRASRDALDRIGAALRHALQERPAGAAPALVDRTLELATRSEDAPAWPGPHVGQHMLIAGLMFGERLEGWRTDVARRILPYGSMFASWTASPWLNPVTACRAHVAEKFAAIEARETYRGSAAG